MSGSGRRRCEDESEDDEVPTVVDIVFDESDDETKKKENNCSTEKNNGDDTQDDVTFLNTLHKIQRGPVLVSLSRMMPKARSCQHQDQQQQKIMECWAKQKIHLRCARRRICWGKTIPDRKELKEIYVDVSNRRAATTIETTSVQRVQIVIEKTSRIDAPRGRTR